MNVDAALLGLMALWAAGLIFGTLIEPIPSPSTSVTKYDERNADEWRALCRNFSQGDPISGEFATPNYPQPYPPNLECVRVIHAPLDYIILLDFRGTFFEIEKSENDNRKPRTLSSLSLEKALSRDINCPFDYLEIRNGAYGFSPLIGRYCGDRFPPVLAADSGSMWLLFRSDHTIQYRGFKAVHYASPKLVCSFSSTFSNGATIFLGTDEMHKVYPDLFAERIPASPIECVWKVEAPTRAHQLRIQFETFDLYYPNECGFNSVEVYAYTTSRSHLVKQFCGRIANYVDTRSHVAYVRIFLTESSFFKTVIRASFISYASGKICDSSSAFSCGDGTCISQGLVCNGRADCFSNLDERKCGTGDKTLLNILNSPYLVILIVIVVLIVVIVVCATTINVWHRVKKRRILYAPVKRAERGTLAPSGDRRPTKSKGLPPPIPAIGPSVYRRVGPVPEPVKPTASGPIELVYSTHVPGPNHPPHLSSRNGRICELLPTITNDDLRLYLCRRGHYVNLDSLITDSIPSIKTPRPCDSPCWSRKQLTGDAPAVPVSIRRSPTIRLPINTGSSGSQLWAATPAATRMHRSATEESTVAYCSSQSTAGESTTNKQRNPKAATDAKRSKRKSTTRASKKTQNLIATSKAYDQSRSSSSSRADVKLMSTHKFWARMEDLITTTEDSSDAADGRRNISAMLDDVANLSDLTNRLSGNDGSSDETERIIDDLENGWIMQDADSVLESESPKPECDDNRMTELILSL